MIVRYSVVTAALLGAILLALRWQSPADPMRTAVAVAERVLKAVEREDYEAFLAEADKSVRKMRPEYFRALVERQAPRLRGGHALHALDSRSRGEVVVSRWKVTFKDGGPDAVLTLGVRAGKVATFAIY
jgi:hypothetical protein